MTEGMNMNDKTIEQGIQAHGANVAPRITPADIEASIVSEHYFTAAQGDQQAQEDAYDGRSVLEKTSPLRLLTFCVLVLRNGTKIVGINYGAISIENHSAEMGREEARKNAVEQIWPLLGYELRTKLAGT